MQAPFDGIVSKHLISVGELVGNGKATKLATIVQLDPIYVEFNMSEQDVLKIRQNLAKRRLTVEELSKIPLDVGLMNEEGYPHTGVMNYVVARDRCADRHHPGARPVQKSQSRPDPGLLRPHQGADGPGPTSVLLIPNRVIAEDQAGKYALVVNKDNVVEQSASRPGSSWSAGCG